MIRFIHRGDLSATKRFLKKARDAEYLKDLKKYGEKGVEALREATPKRTGKTANSWYYEIHGSGSEVSIVWSNSNVNEGANIAVLILFGHGLKNGGYVKGIDYINPALRSVFEDIGDSAWKEVTSL